MNNSVLKNGVYGEIELPASKSISNRLQIINALSSNQIEIKNLSNARDTQLLKSILSNPHPEKDVKDAGTAMRFLTAFYAISNQNIVLKGTERMHQRPIKILVDALNSLGANISYINKNGYPPLKIAPFSPINACVELEIDSTVSSQFVSAILMIAPLLTNGLWLKLNGEIASKPYIKMTLMLMESFGIEWNWERNKILIKKSAYTEGTHTVESDWSAASYWYAFLALSNQGTVYLKGLQNNSLQGDAIVTNLFENFGVKTIFDNNGAIITKISNVNYPKSLEINFSSFPDLAQTVAVVCAVKGINLTLTGIESLKIKETNRIEALQTELLKIGSKLTIVSNNIYVLEAQTLRHLTEKIYINTYEDHRMAMAFAPISLFGDVFFDDETVVQKSYPNFWEQLKYNLCSTPIK